jgi:tRNA(adenine34) deaminase
MSQDVFCLLRFPFLKETFPQSYPLKGKLSLYLQQKINQNFMDEQQTMKPQDDIFYMQRAMEEAKVAATAGEIPVGAVVVCGGRIIARAHNLTETLCDVTAHAEMQAITAAANALGGKYLNQCTLYVTVEPCVMCAGAIGWSQLGRLVYGAADEKRGYHIFAPDALHPKTEVVSGVLADESAQLMRDFFKEKR